MENIIKELISYENKNKSIRQEMEFLGQRVELLEKSKLIGSYEFEIFNSG